MATHSAFSSGSSGERAGCRIRLATWHDGGYEVLLDEVLGCLVLEKYPSS